MSPTRVTTDMVVKFDVFEGVLHAAMQEVSRDNRDVDIKQIDAKTADLRRLRQEMLS